ncbi:hypothetical protein Tco_0815188 [Tanacetum coccineum]
MDAAAMKHMALNFAKLDKFERVDFRRWQKKMHFLLSSMSVVYVLTTPIPGDGGDDATVEQIRKRAKRDNDDYVYKELWNSLGAKYMAEDASNKKFLVSNFTNYKMTDSRPVMEQYNEIFGILGRLGHVYFKRMQDMSKDGLIPAFDMDIKKCKTCMLNKITKKPFQNVKRETKVLELIHNDLCDLHATPSLGNKKYFVTFIDDVNRDIECIFVGYVAHSKAFKFYDNEPNYSVSINSIIGSRGVIFDENRFSYSHQSLDQIRGPLLNGTEDIGCLVVHEEVTEEVIRQPKLALRKSKRTRTPKDFGPEFQLYLIEGTMDEVSDQHSYCFNVEDDPKTFE